MRQSHIKVLRKFEFKIYYLFIYILTCLFTYLSFHGEKIGTFGLSSGETAIGVKLIMLSQS